MRSSTWDARKPIHIFRVLGLARDSGLSTATNKLTFKFKTGMHWIQCERMASQVCHSNLDKTPSINLVASVSFQS